MTIVRLTTKQFTVELCALLPSLRDQVFSISSMNHVNSALENWSLNSGQGQRKLVVKFRPNTVESWLSNSIQGRAEADTSYSVSPGSTPGRFGRICTKWHCKRVPCKLFGVPSSLSFHQRPVLSHVLIHSFIHPSTFNTTQS